MFEGEYLNNKKWSGIGFNILGNKELEIKNGSGKGKEFNTIGKLNYEGE